MVRLQFLEYFAKQTGFLKSQKGPPFYNSRHCEIIQNEQSV